MNKYLKFGLMIATSTAVMLVLMYLNTYQWDHIFFSQTRLYMAFIMGAAMAVVMLSFMQDMYDNRRLNIGIYVGSVVIFVAALWLVRSQATIGDVAWMRAMIPHHSIAILTSERAELSDPRVQELANEIIEAQRSEIAEMKRLIEDLENGETAAHSRGPLLAGLPSAAGCSPPPLITPNPAACYFWEE